MNTVLSKLAAVSCVFVAGFVLTSGPVSAQGENDDQAELEKIVIEAPMVHRRVEKDSPAHGKTEAIELRRRVSIADLDLTRHADVVALEARIEEAARDSCKRLADMFPLISQGRTEIARCTKKAIDSAEEQKQAAISEAGQ